jgi:hypothetical protein
MEKWTQMEIRGGSKSVAKKTTEVLRKEGSGMLNI